MRPAPRSHQREEDCAVAQLLPSAAAPVEGGAVRKESAAAVNVTGAISRDRHCRESQLSLAKDTEQVNACYSFLRSRLDNV